MEGFTSIRSVTLTLRDLNVLVGANGAGKSNFIRALSTLGRIVDSELGLFVGLSGGANALLSVDKAVPRLIRLGVKSDAGEYAAELIPAAGDALTQSVTLMNQFELDDLIVVERQEGSSVFERPDPGRLDDGVHTAPSKRIMDAYPQYTKTLDGPLVIADAGLDSIRSSCPHMDDWLREIETRSGLSDTLSTPTFP